MADTPPWRTLMEGAHSALDFRPSGQAQPALCITFDALDAPHRPPHVPLDAVIAAKGAAHAHVSTRRNDWYHNPDLPALTGALQRLRRAHGRVVLYGASMGGYGALMLSGAVEADRVVAVVPQFCVDPLQPPHEQRWKELAKEIAFGREGLAALCSPTAEKYIVYDPGLEEDAAHAALLRRLPNTHPAPTPGAGHYPLQFLHQAGLLHAYLEELLFGRPDLARLSRWRRGARRRSSRYMCQLAMWLARRGDVRGAGRALSQAVFANPKGAEVVESAIFVLCALDPTGSDGLVLLTLRLLLHEHPALAQYRPMLEEYQARVEAGRRRLQAPEISPPA